MQFLIFLHTIVLAQPNSGLKIKMVSAEGNVLPSLLFLEDEVLWQVRKFCMPM